MDIHNDYLWATPTWTSKLDNIDNKELSEWILDYKKNNNSSEISNKGGWQHLIDSQNPICRNLMGSIMEMLRAVKLKPGKKNIKCVMWANVNGKGDWNMMHNHMPEDISGIYYVKVPDDSHGTLVLKDPRGVYISPQIDQTPNHLYIEPEENVLFMFPSFLDHIVFPNKSNEDRISIAFNITIEDG